MAAERQLRLPQFDYPEGVSVPSTRRKPPVS